MTNNLKREIPPIENRLAEIKTPKTTGPVILDATKSIADYETVFRELRHRFGHKSFLEMTANADATENDLEAKREATRALQLEKAEKQRQSEDTPLTRFIRAIKLKNASYDPLNEWKTKHTNEEKKVTLAEFENLAARRGLTLTEDQIAFGINFLQAIITTATSEPPHSIINRIKERLGA